MLLTKIIHKIKGNKDYAFESPIPTKDLIIILFYRGIQVWRGLLMKPFLRHKGILFLGKNTQLRHKSSLSIGKSCIIDNQVVINGFSQNGIRLGNNVTLSQGCILMCSGVIRNKGVGITIGNNVGMNVRGFISGQGGVTIEDDVIMGPDVKIIAENHLFESLDIPIRLQGESRKGIIIRSNCWLGANVTILDGVDIGKGCVVAAGAVVTKSFPPYSVIGGVPAKLIKSRIPL